MAAREGICGPPGPNRALEAAIGRPRARATARDGAGGGWEERRTAGSRPQRRPLRRGAERLASRAAQRRSGFPRNTF